MNIAASMMRALPQYRGGRRPAGATNRTSRTVAPVIGAPSMRVLRKHAGEGGPVQTVLSLRMQHADLLTDAEIRELETLWAPVINEAKRLSQGTLSLSQLRKRGHPYGYGRRAGLGRMKGAGRGVSNLAVVNKQSGTFASRWGGYVERNKRGISFILANDAHSASFLAFGTKRMRAHGPFTTAPAKHKARITGKWRALARKANSRHNALAQMEAAGIGRNRI